MPSSKLELDPQKVSREFAARLARLKEDEPVHVLVLLEVPASKRIGTSGRRPSSPAVAEVSAASLAEVDQILNAFGGEKLRPRPDALGALPVELPVRGIAALATSGAVKAIIEDQPIRALSTAQR